MTTHDLFMIREHSDRASRSTMQDINHESINKDDSVQSKSNCYFEWGYCEKWDYIYMSDFAMSLRVNSERGQCHVHGDIGMSPWSRESRCINCVKM